MNKGRLEAFTDAIAAIAATIMVLELHTPASEGWQGLLESGHIFLAYVISFAMIYIVWYNYHNLFQKAKRITKRTYLLNGLWLFFLTLVPFTTGWVGVSPDAAASEFLYALNLLLWSAAFHLLDRRILLDNAGAERDTTTGFLDRAFLYGGYAACMALAFLRPRWSLYLIGVITTVLVARIFAAKEA